MPELPPNDPPVVSETQEGHDARRSKPIKCEFCDCVLAPSGDVLRRGERATEYQKQEDRLAERDRTIEKLQAEIRGLREDLQVAAGAKKSFLNW